MTANTNARAFLAGAQTAARYLTRVDACATNGACMPYAELHRQLVALGGLHREETHGFLQHIQDQLQLMHFGPAPHRTVVRPDVIGRIVRSHVDKWYSGPSDASLVDALSEAVVDVLTNHPQAMPHLAARSLWLQATHDVIVDNPPLPATYMPPWEPTPPTPSNTAGGA